MSEIRRQPSPLTQKPSLNIGDKLGEFVITGFAGKGATSYVYRAEHIGSNQPVAVKVLNPAYANDEVKRGRFLREAEMMIKLDHPNVVFFHEVCNVDGQLAFIMEYIDGLQLNEWLQEYQEEVDEVTITCLFIDILRGLNHAHENGIFHRDLKPANVMVTRDGDRWIAKIIDFGVARIAAEPIPEEDRDKIVGTAAYISPEEIRDPETVCKSSDIYSIGVMLYEALCGRRPFEGMPVSELMKAHVKQDPERPREINPNISSLFEALLLRSLTKSPQERFDSAGELINALEEIARRNQEVNPVKLDIDPSENASTTIWLREESETIGEMEKSDQEAKPKKGAFLNIFRQFFLFALATVFRRKPVEQQENEKDGESTSRTTLTTTSNELLLETKHVFIPEEDSPRESKNSDELETVQVPPPF